MDTASKGISSSIRRKLSILLENLKKDPNFAIFIEPIDPIRDGCIDYFEVIKNPMDLKTVSSRLIDDKYNNILEFYDDIMLIFSNCREYNTSPLCSSLINSCNKSEEKFLLEWGKLGFTGKSNKRRLPIKNNDYDHLNVNNKNESIRNNHISQNITQGIKVNTIDNNKSNKKNNLNRVILKIDKDNIPSNVEQSNKRNKGDQKKNIPIPLKKRKEEHYEDLTSNKSNDNSVVTSIQNNNDWKSECLRILNLLRKEDNSFLFENPVLESNDLTEETKIRYKEIVSETSDYFTIEKRLNNKKINRKKQSSKNSELIENPHEFERLIKLVFSNCMLFNPNTGDCKWIYDSAKQSLNKFNNIWSKSNVFTLYFNSNHNFRDNRDNYSDTSIGLSISNSYRNKHIEKSDLNAQNKIPLNFKNIYPISSFNKIITQWNNYSILWRQFILNNNSNNNDIDNDNNNCEISNSNQNINNKNSKQNYKSNSNFNKKMLFNIPISKKQTLISNFYINEYFDIQESDHLNVINYETKFKINNIQESKSNQLDSSDDIEYNFPLKIHLINNITHYSQLLEYIGNHCFHQYKIHQLHKDSNIHIYCFQSKENKLDCNDDHDHNIIKNLNFLTFTNNRYLNNKYVELKITISKSLNKILFLSINQFKLYNLLVFNIKIIIKNRINNVDGKINIKFGQILNL